MEKNIINLYESVVYTISCEYCGNEFDQCCDDAFECAEAADEEGLVVNRQGKVKCPECVDKMKKK